MKKSFLTCLSILLLAFSITGCSTDTTHKPSAVTFDAQNISFDSSEMKSIAAVKVQVDSSSRAVSVNESLQTILMYADKHDDLKPFVFTDPSGRYMVFNVDKTYPLDDNAFAIDFSEIYVLDKLPILEKKEDLYELDLSSIVEKYVFRGQLLINSEKSKAVFLNNIGSFIKQSDGVYIQDAYHGGLNYNLDNAFYNNGNLYVISYASNGNCIYRISMDNPTEALPLTVSGYFSPHKIVAGNSKVLIVDGSKGDSYGLFIVDITAQHGVTPTIYYLDYVDPNTGYRYDVGFGMKDSNTLQLGEEFWNIGTSFIKYQLLEDSNGNHLKLTTADGFWIGDKWYASENLDFENEYRISIKDNFNAITGNIDLDHDLDGYYLERNSRQYLYAEDGQTKLLNMENHIKDNIFTYDGNTVENTKDVRYDNKGNIIIEGCIKTCAYRINIDDQMQMTFDSPALLNQELGYFYPQVLNVKESNLQGVYTIYVNINNDGGKRILELSLDTKNNELICLNSFPHDMNLPYEYSYPNISRRYDPDHHVVTAKDGDQLFWIENDRNLNMLDMADKTSKTITVPKGFASKAISRVGDLLYFHIQDSGIEVGTYTLNINDLDAQPQKVSSTKMDVVPLVELNMINL